MNKINHNYLSKLFSKIDEFLQLELGDVEEGAALVEEICECIEKIPLSILEKEDRKDYRFIISKLKEISSKMATDSLNSKEGLLSADWRRIARQGQVKLRKQVLNLQKFLRTHENVLRKQLYRENLGFDFQELVDRLREADCIDPLIGNRLSKQIRDMEADEKWRKIEKFSDRLNRVSHWFRLLREVENVG